MLTTNKNGDILSILIRIPFTNRDFQTQERRVNLEDFWNLGIISKYTRTNEKTCAPFYAKIGTNQIADKQWIWGPAIG